MRLIGTIRCVWLCHITLQNLIAQFLVFNNCSKAVYCAGMPPGPGMRPMPPGPMMGYPSNAAPPPPQMPPRPPIMPSYGARY